MSELDKAVEKFFNDDQKITLKTLFEEVEKALDVFDLQPLTEEEEERPRGRFSYSIPFPALVPTEAWGDPKSQSRKEIARIFASVSGGDNIKARIQSVNGFLKPEKVEAKTSLPRIVNMMMIIEALQATLNDYNEASAGFVFEAFMAALTQGKQESGRVGGTLPIEDFITREDDDRRGERVSLKLLSPDTNIHGSFTNLIDYLFVRAQSDALDAPASGEEAIKYLIAYKSIEGDDVQGLQIFDFMITRDNVIDVMLQSANAGLLGGKEDALKDLISRFQPGDAEWLKEMGDLLRGKFKKTGRGKSRIAGSGVPGYTESGMFYKNMAATPNEADPINPIYSGDFFIPDPEEAEAAKEKKKAAAYGIIRSKGELLNQYKAAAQAAKDRKPYDQTYARQPRVTDNHRDKRNYDTGYKRGAYLAGLEDGRAGTEFDDFFRKDPKASFASPEANRGMPLFSAGTDYKNGYEQGVREREQQEPAIAAESYSYFGEFHEREKRLMKEELLLMEAGKADTKSQWGISRTQMDAMKDLILTDYHGEVDLSTENIEKLAELYAKKLEGPLMELLNTVKTFTENIGQYFSLEDRSAAATANTDAIADGNKIVGVLAAKPLETK